MMRAEQRWAHGVNGQDSSTLLFAARGSWGDEAGLLARPTRRWEWSVGGRQITQISPRACVKGMAAAVPLQLYLFSVNRKGT